MYWKTLIGIKLFATYTYEKKNKPTNIGIVKLSLMVLLNFYAQKSVVFFVVNHAYLYGHM